MNYEEALNLLYFNRAVLLETFHELINSGGLKTFYIKDIDKEPEEFYNYSIFLNDAVYVSTDFNFGQKEEEDNIRELDFLKSLKDPHSTFYFSTFLPIIKNEEKWIANACSTEIFFEKKYYFDGIKNSSIFFTMPSIGLLIKEALFKIGYSYDSNDNILQALNFIILKNYKKNLNLNKKKYPKEIVTVIRRILKRGAELIILWLYYGENFISYLNDFISLNFSNTLQFKGILYLSVRLITLVEYSKDQKALINLKIKKIEDTIKKNKKNNFILE